MPNRANAGVVIASRASSCSADQAAAAAAPGGAALSARRPIREDDAATRGALGRRPILATWRNLIIIGRQRGQGCSLLLRELKQGRKRWSDRPRALRVRTSFYLRSPES